MTICHYRDHRPKERPDDPDEHFPRPTAGGDNYRRLERDEAPGPIDLRILVNASIAMAMPHDDLIEDHWRQWWTISTGVPSPPDIEMLWRYWTLEPTRARH